MDPKPCGSELKALSPSAGSAVSEVDSFAGFLVYTVAPCRRPRALARARPGSGTRRHRPRPGTRREFPAPQSSHPSAPRWSRRGSPPRGWSWGSDPIPAASPEPIPRGRKSAWTCPPTPRRRPLGGSQKGARALPVSSARPGPRRAPPVSSARPGPRRRGGAGWRRARGLPARPPKLGAAAC